MIKLLSKLFIKNYQDYSDNQVRSKYGVLTGVFGIFLNIICSLMKIIIGALSGSIAILSDGLNNVADISSSVVGIFAAKLSNKKPDKDHPFGHGRFEYIGSLVVSFLVMFMGAELIIESVKKIINPEPIEFNIALVICLIISIIIKLYMFAYNRIYSKKINSLVLKATSTDSLFDSITTTVILLATLLSQIPSLSNIPFDGIGGCVVGLLICYGGFNIAKESIATLLGVPPTEETINELVSIIMSGEGILGTHDLMIHDYGPGRQFASVHVEIDEKDDIVKVHEVVDKIEGLVFEKMGMIITIHMDPISTSEETKYHKQVVIETVKKVNEEYSIHDFRMVNGEKQINVIFDLVVPHHITKTKEEIAHEVKEALHKIDARYYAVIQVECSYA